MSKKKILGAVTAAAIALGSICCPGFAADGGEQTPEAGVEFTVADSLNDIIRLEVTNPDLDGNQVSLYIFNPGKSAADLSADGSAAAREAIYQVLVVDFSGTKKEFDIKMKQPAGENHVYNYMVISQKSDIMSGSFEYYTKAEKDALLEEINAAGESQEVPPKLAERIDSYFGMEFELYDSVSGKDKISELFLSMVKETEVTAENIGGFFEHAAVAAAFSENGNALLKDGKFAYAEYINPGEEYLKYYNENLNAGGMEKSILNICGREYNSIDEIRKNLETEILVNAINNNKLNGYGHIETVISDFEEDFSNAGLKADDYNKSDKDEVGRRFMQKSKQNTLEDISKTLNSIISDIDKPGTGGSGGGSGGAGGGGGGGYVPNSSKGQDADDGASIANPSASDPEIKENKPQEVIFSDLAGYEWAKDSIEKLYKSGVISGRGEGKFAPADTITREEFTVILVNAFDVGEGTSAPRFGDVSSSRWSYSYISRAFSEGLISGDGKNFMPEDKITRQDISAILVRALMNKGVIADIKPEGGIFDDESDISPYALESVQIMAELGVVSGDGTGKFNPKDNATRAEAAVIVQRALELI